MSPAFCAGPGDAGGAASLAGCVAAFGAVSEVDPAPSLPEPRSGTRRVRAIRTSRGEIPCDALFLALGHSARDTVRELHRHGMRVAPKPFQLGVRIEHPQELIDRGRYGTGPEAALLGPAYYNLVCRGGGGLPSTYSFCMCPGGRIVASVNSPGVLCTNGMSNSMH